MCLKRVSNPDFAVCRLKRHLDIWKSVCFSSPDFIVILSVIMYYSTFMITIFLLLVFSTKNQMRQHFNIKCKSGGDERLQVQMSGVSEAYSYF